MDFLPAWCLTISIETALLFILLRRRYGISLIVRNSLIANTLTLPFVWFLFPALGLGSWALQTALAEIFAFLAEAGVYRMLFPGIGWSDALRVSFLCNAASFLAGVLLF